MVAVTVPDPHATDINPLVADVAPDATNVVVLLPVLIEELAVCQ